jgi:MFS family permease
MRFLTGGLMSFINPFSYSIIQCWFPPFKRSSANSIFNSSVFIGAGISSLNLIAVKEFGWREVYEYMGIIGILTGIFGLIFIYKPEE